MSAAVPESDERRRLIDAYRALRQAGDQATLRDFERRHPGILGCYDQSLSTEVDPSEGTDCFKDPARLEDRTEQMLTEETGTAQYMGETSPPDRVDPRAVAAASAPARLGDFRLVRKVGQGGMGIVFEAVQESLGRRVALKVLPQAFLHGGDGVRRFEREARAAGRLHHTNIVPVFGVGQEGDTHYYVMQFIDGLPLSDIIMELRRETAASSPRPGRRQTQAADELVAAPLNPAAVEIATTLWRDDAVGEERVAPGTPRGGSASAAESGQESASGAHPAAAGLASTELLLPAGPTSARSWRRFAQNVARVGRQAAEALAHAHEQGVLHRDIKPSNLMIDRHGTVWVADFGLAKSDDSEDLTSTGAIVGTLRYIAPERFNGQCDARSDLYALGLTLYELLAMRPAYDARDRNSLLRQLNQAEPPPLEQLNRAIPRDLVTIIHRTIDREPGARYQTARELADDLKRYLENRPIRARRLYLAERLLRWCRRNPAIAGLSASILALLLIGAIGSTVAAFRFRRLAVSEGEAHREAEYTLADMYTFSGLRAGREGNPAQASLWFASAAAKARTDTERQRDNRVRYQSWSQAVPKTIQAFQIPGVNVDLLRFHPREPLLLVCEAEQRTGCKIWDSTAGRFLSLPPTAAAARLAGWSPDGQKVAWVTDDGVSVHRYPVFDRIAHLPSPEGGPYEVMAWSPDGSRLAVSRGGRVWVWALEGDERVELPEHPTLVSHLVFGRQGQRLATRCTGDEARVFDVPADRSRVALVSGPLPSTIGMAWENGPIEPMFLDGDTRLLTITGEQELTFWDIATGGLLERVPLSDSVFRIVPAPDGRTFVVCGSRGAQLWSAATRAPVGDQLRHGNYVYAAAYRPDGLAILTVGADRVARIWSVPEGKPLTPPLLHQSEIWHAGFDSTGKRFATGQADGLFRVLRTAADLVSDRSIPLDGQESLVSVSPDGQLAAPGGWVQRRYLRKTRVYNTRTGEPAGPPIEAEGLINHAVFAPAGTGLLVLSSTAANADQTSRDQMRLQTQPGVVRLFDGRTGEAAGPRLQTPSEPLGASWHPDGTRAAIHCAGGEVLIIDPASGRVLEAGERGNPALLGFLAYDWVRYAPGGAVLATWGGAWGAEIRDGKTGAIRHRLDEKTHCHDAFFTADGRILFTAASSGMLQAWDVETGKPISPSLSHPDWVFSARLSPDGKQLVAACRDGLAWVWNWREGTLACPPLSHGDEVFSAVYSANGEWIFTTCRDGTVRSWDAETGIAVGPPLPTPGTPYQAIPCERDTRLLVSGIMPRLQLVALSAFRVSANPASLEAIRLEAELSSGQTLHPAGGIVNLTTREWFERWQAEAEAHGTAAGPGSARH